VGCGPNMGFGVGDRSRLKDIMFLLINILPPPSPSPYKGEGILKKVER